ncbi:hypothetical protein BANRA_01601 [Klebsiella pneumoniae]|nr:hypothetical protein BANRA_01601 [Klebsiella pneumoniae]
MIISITIVATSFFNHTIQYTTFNCNTSLFKTSYTNFNFLCCIQLKSSN